MADEVCQGFQLMCDFVANKCRKIAIFEQFFGHNKMHVYIFDFFFAFTKFQSWEH